jgi:ABC-type glycerol-3-phosphate transport system permease component
MNSHEKPYGLKRLKRRKLRGRIVSWLLVLTLILLVGFPLFWMALSSLKPSIELFKMPPTFFPKNPSFGWYVKAFGNSLVGRYFLNSFIVASSTMIIDVVLGTMGAYSLARFRYRGRKAITVGVLSAYCIPPIMLMIPLYRIIAGIGLSSSYLGVIIGHVTVTFPFCIWLLISFFKKIPREIEDAAFVDGTSDFGVFFLIILPLCMPGILSTGIMAFILSWNEYLLSSVLVSSDSMKTLTVGLANYISSTEIDWGVIMALGTATTIPIVILFTAIQKYFVEGMTAGAIKG